MSMAAADRMQALRDSGQWRADPVRFRYLEALSARIAGQPEAVRRLLERKLHAAIEDYASRPPDAAPVVQPHDDLACTPLLELNAHIRQRAAERAPVAEPGDTPRPDELASARRFRRTWERHRTLDQLEQSLARRPANAGPLNSHALVLRSLRLMQALSPDYLRRFLGYAQALQWLEVAQAKYPRESAARAAKPAARSRRRK